MGKGKVSEDENEGKREANSGAYILKILNGMPPGPGGLCTFKRLNAYRILPVLIRGVKW